MAYDSRTDTLLHARRVGALLTELITELMQRAMSHDWSKTQPPEVGVFDEYTPRLAGLTYGTEEYKACLQAMGDGLAHHYAANRHHPEHFPDGVAGMTLIDLAEMLADWKAATERVKDGDLDRSLVINQERFTIDDQLAVILRNTARAMRWVGE